MFWGPTNQSDAKKRVSSGLLVDSARLSWMIHTLAMNHRVFAGPLTLFAPSSPLQTPKAWPPSPRRSHAVHHSSPRFAPGEITSPPLPAIMFPTPAWNPIAAKSICEICYSWILSHAKFIEKSSCDLRHDILDQGRILKKSDLVTA